MKHKLCILAALVLGLFTQDAFAADEPSAGAKPAMRRIGVYDSRVVAYAHFWTDKRQQELKELFVAAEAAKKAGDQERLKALKTRAKEGQSRSHRQVFGGAPAGEAMTALEDRLAEIKKEAGVDSLVSKWDKETLKAYKGAEQVEVTDLIVREFKPGEKQRKIIEDIKTKPLVPLDQCAD